MCYSAEISFLTFTLGTIASIALIKYGNPSYHLENTVFGLYAIYLASVQLMDFVFWMDLDNRLGLNKLATIIGSFFNMGQPFLLYLIKMAYLSPTIASPIDYTVGLINAIYVIYLLVCYTNFLKGGKLTVSSGHGHLIWPWVKYERTNVFLFMMALNVFYLTNFYYSLLVFAIVYAFYIISNLYFSYNIGEMWCFFGASVSAIVLLITNGKNILG
jgi:hypothetical protein